jgi:predicted Zn finger-like uncharacterized protein
MIVVCPSCSTRYRHGAAAEAVAAATAECSRCDERFPLAPARRPYVIRGQQPAGVPPRIAALAAGPVPGVADEAFAIDPPAGPEHEQPAVATPAEAARRTAPGSSAVTEALVAVLPAVAGAGLAYDLAGRQHQDPVTWAALGGAVGLLLGWACLLWIARKD